MRLINPNDMVLALKGGAVRAWEYYLYIAVWVIALALIPWLWVTTDYANNLIRYVDFALMLGVVVVGTVLAWLVNKRGDGKEFWKRYISIDISLIFLTLVFSFIAGFMFALVSEFISGGEYFIDTTVRMPDLVFNAVMELVLLAWSLALMRKVSR